MTRPVTDDGLVELEQAAAALDHVGSALQEVHSLSGMGDPAFDASMFGQISAVNRGASLLRRAALVASWHDTLIEAREALTVELTNERRCRMYLQDQIAASDRDVLVGENTRLRELLIETQDTIRDVANGGEPRFGDLWRKIDAALIPLAGEL